MTKRKIARTRTRTKGRTETPVDSEIRRAARRAGIKERAVLTFEDHMKLNQGEQLEKLYRACGYTDARWLSEQLRATARQMADRAFALHPKGMGVDTDGPNVPELREGLIRVCDRLSETLAILNDCEDADGLNRARADGFLDNKILDALQEAWELRWELGSGAEEIREIRAPQVPSEVQS